MGGGGRGGRSRGADLRADLAVTFAEAVTGCSKELNVRRHAPCAACHGSGARAGTGVERCGTCGGRGQVLHQQGFFMISTACPTCRGQGSVIREKCPECRGSGATEAAETITLNVPAGIDDGRRMRVSGKGEAGPPGGATGNLLVDIHVAEDPRFQRDGADVHTVAVVPYAVAVLGGHVDIPTLENGAQGTAQIEIDAGTQPGTVLTRKGEGLAHLEAYGRGHQYVHVEIEVPKKLTDRQKELLRAYAAEGGAEIKVEEKRSFFGRRKKR